MANFLPHTTRKITFTDSYEFAPSVPNNTNNRASLPQGVDRVGATGDNVSNNTRNKASFQPGLSKVGDTGDNAAKRGTGK